MHQRCAETARTRQPRVKQGILAISGSIRTGSVNAQLLRAVSALAADELDVMIWDELAQVPPFTPDADLLPESVRSLRAAIATCDALLISSPEYNFSVPGQLKNAIDWASHPIADSPFAGKPTAVIGASSDPASEANWARSDLRRILGVVGARIVGPDLLVLRADEAFAADGRLPEHEHALLDVLRELRSAVHDRGLTEDSRSRAATGN